jgi:hypothetical protein
VDERTVEQQAMEARPRPCRDCRVPPGVRHGHGCGVARCKGCGGQARLCVVHRHLVTTVWTGHEPGLAEAAEMGVGMNELAMLHIRGDLVWDVDTEVLRAGPETADELARAIALLGLHAVESGLDGAGCRLCEGFDTGVTVGPRIAHQPGCLLLRSVHWLRREHPEWAAANAAMRPPEAAPRG